MKFPELPKAKSFSPGSGIFVPLVALVVVVALTLLGRCSNGSADKSDSADGRRLPDTLRVATLYSPTSFFIYKEEMMGYDYALIKKFVTDKGITMQIFVAPNLQDMVEWLDSGKVDLIAYEIPLTAEYRETIVECGPRSESYQVLVQPRKKDVPLITDETQLVGRDIYVESDSKYYYRLVNLDNELGGGINIHLVERDTLITEDLIRMVSAGTIPLTVVDNNIALLNKTYYPDIDVSLRLSFAQLSAWAVSPRNHYLADSIDAWLSLDEPRNAQAKLMKKYFELSKTQKSNILIDLTQGHISPYDNLFKRYADSIDYDWRLLAAQGYVESHFDSTLTSWAGARGIMQIMPHTAVAYGTDPATLIHPVSSIKTSCRVLSDLMGKMSRHVPDATERSKFVLGAYNAGLAHVYDAMALARKYGYDPKLWDNNVAECMIMKSKPEFYNDSVCKYGYARGLQTVAYVAKVMDFYEQTLKYIKK